jgi:hypothetical protein
MLKPIDFFRAMLEISDCVIVTQNFRRFTKQDKHFAAYMQQDGDCDFTLTFDRNIVNDPDPLYYIETLAHELTHVAQYASGKMVDGCGSIVYWDGQAIDESTADYWLLPWEVEAREKQLELTLAWLAYNERHH